MRKSNEFETRLRKTIRRHHGARSLFDSALEELERAAEEYDRLESAIEQKRYELMEQAREAASGSAQATRVAARIRELIS